MNLSKELVNNYVFQNRYKAYFSNSLYKILDYLEPNAGLSKMKAASYSLNLYCGNKYRTISLPNIFLYSYAVQEICSSKITDFGKISSSMNRMRIDFDERKFKRNSYTSFLDERLGLLIANYDKMYKIDIKSFYKQIYTHVFEKIGENIIDVSIRSFNNKKTNGILLGNLLSTFSANEIMEFLSNKINAELKESCVLYFSDQFYIFYNESDYSDEKIFNTVSNIIGEDYFEFKINDKDSNIFKYEDLIVYKNFNRKINSLIENLNIKFNKKQKKIIDEDESLNKLIHFFNSFIIEYYSIPEEHRFSFAEVTIKRSFSSPINLYRLSLAIKDDPFGICNPDSNKIIDALILMLKNHPSLILVYLKIGIIFILEKYSSYYKKKKNNIKKYFEKKLYKTLDTVESIYYYHICFVITDIDKREEFARNLLDNYEVNLLLKSILHETFKFEVDNKVISKYKYNDENWLLEYTIYVNSNFNLNINKSTNKIVKTIKKCKENNVRIIQSLDNIKFNNSLYLNYLKIEKINKKNVCNI